MSFLIMPLQTCATVRVTLPPVSFFLPSLPLSFHCELRMRNAKKRDEKEAQENAIREVIMPNDDSNCCALLSTHYLHPALSVLPS